MAEEIGSQEELIRARQERGLHQLELFTRPILAAEFFERIRLYRIDCKPLMDNSLKSRLPAPQLKSSISAASTV